MQFGHELNSIIKIKADRNSLKNKKIGQLFVVYYLLTINEQVRDFA